MAIERTSECITKLEKNILTSHDAEVLRAHWESIKFIRTEEAGIFAGKLWEIKRGVENTLEKVEKYCGIVYKEPVAPEKPLGYGTQPGLF